MYHDARELSADTRLDCDVLIVGAGIAGLSLAHGLISTAGFGGEIIILESGDDDFIRAARQRPLDHHEAEPELSPRPPETFANRLNHGSATIHDAFGGQRRFDEFPFESRCRGLGGTGRLWGGKMAPLDPIDLATRHWLEHCEWPFDYTQLKPYLDRACELFQLPHFHAQAPIRPDDLRPPLIINQERNISTGFRRYTAIAGRAQAARFAQFIDQVCQNPQVHCYLNATATQLISQHHGEINRLDCRASGGAAFTVQAKNYVLAAGGLETPRLLLHSRNTWPDSWRQSWSANDSSQDPLGAYFMGHTLHRRPNHAGRSNLLESPLAAQSWQLYWDKDPKQVQGILQLSSRAQRRARLPNFSLTLEPTAQDSPVNSESAAFQSSAYFMVEQLPQVNSRLRLLNADEAACDDTGVPLLHLDWHFQRADFDHLSRAAELMATELQRHQVATLHYQIEHDAVIHQIDIARHHIGTTRMHENPKLGVVNKYCRVHGLDNLFCIGASVFPTSGIANPTLAIVALSLRLSEQLK